MSSHVTNPQLGTIKLSTHFIERAQQRLGASPSSLPDLISNTIEPTESIKSLIQKGGEFKEMRSDGVADKHFLLGGNYLILLTKQKRIPQLRCGFRPVWLAKTVVRLKDPAVLKAIALERMAF